MRFGKVAVIGVGLIGGSFALALKRKRLCGSVVGAGRSRANLRLARRRGVIDAIAPDAARAARDADLVLVATPVSHFERIFSEIGGALKPAAVVTDAGSTKRDVVAAARKGLGVRVSQFVPAHPIAGAERSGAAAARADLFQGRRVILTPLAGNSRASVAAVEAAWRGCGARLGRMTPREHDAVLAAVSHLPHLLAYGLVSDIAGRRNAAQLFGFAAGGFRDFTRIASSHPEMWRDIAAANRDFLLSEVRGFEAVLRRIKSLLAKGDYRALEALFARARAAREKWLRGGYG
ncbi:MAG TPA: prephenate dehydrogenase/arogenate dehydrogenase family protein [Burkholderiales bacterium]|nr:prephenate dehydrogenase/arogenate dehydrogenase family protein [Burkholderiales bacterium]